MLRAGFEPALAAFSMLERPPCLAWLHYRSTTYCWDGGILNLSIAIKRLCITGTPGVGKTTISLKIAKIMGAKYIDLGKLVIKQGWISGYNHARRSFIVSDEIAGKLKLYLTKFEKYVIDTHYCELVPSECIDMVVVLRLRPDVLFERLSMRGYSSKKVCENTLAEVLDSCLISAIEAHGRDRVIEVDTTGKSVDCIVEEVLKLVSKRERRIGVVNWLQEIDYEFLLKLERGLQGP